VNAFIAIIRQHILYTPNKLPQVVAKGLFFNLVTMTKFCEGNKIKIAGFLRAGHI